MTELVTLMLIFLSVGIGFLLVNLFMGKLIRPSRPSEEKGTIYECGESPVGSSWIQFDLRFYVVALLFVIFDVEMAFFFPWAVVFGSSNELANNDQLTAEQRIVIQKRLSDDPLENSHANYYAGLDLEAKAKGTPSATVDQLTTANQEAAKQLARLAFLDVLIFFGVLLVGFAYLWKRGDLEWVRGMAGQTEPEPSETVVVGGM